MPTSLVFYAGSTGRSESTQNVTFGDEAMRITSGGNVGIGNSEPGVRLSIKTTDTFDPNAAPGTCGLAIQQSRGTAGNGNYSTGLTFSKIDSGRPYGSIAGVQTDNDNDVGGLAFFTSSGSTPSDTVEEVMRLAGNGNVGIGTTDPQALLDVNGDAEINGLTVGRGAGGISTNSVLGFQALQSNTTGINNTAVGHQAGNVITTGSRNTIFGQSCDTSAADGDDQIVVGYNLTGKGNETAFIGGTNGAYNEKNVTTWETTSDQRIKKNIVDNTDGLDVISQIQVRNFEYRAPDEITELPGHAAIKQEGTQIGVIAQELQQVLPECVSENSTGVLSVNTDPLVWYLINAVKELKAEIEELKGN